MANLRPPENLLLAALPQAERERLDPFLEFVADGACECYSLMQTQFDKIFDQPWGERSRRQERVVER